VAQITEGELGDTRFSAAAEKDSWSSRDSGILLGLNEQ
jgi:hypothetical protein